MSGLGMVTQCSHGLYSSEVALGSRTRPQPFYFPIIISLQSTDQLFVEAAGRPPSLLLGQQCRSGRSLCLPPLLVKVGNTKTNSGDRLRCIAAQHTSYKNSNPQCRFGPKLKSPQNTNIFSNLAGTAGGRIYAAWKPIASITHGRCFRGQTLRCPLWIVFPASPEFCIFPQKPSVPSLYIGRGERIALCGSSACECATF